MFACPSWDWMFRLKFDYLQGFCIFKPRYTGSWLWMIARITGVVGVQLIKSLMYLIYTISTPIRSWGSTLTLPDILVDVPLAHAAVLGFNSYTPWYTWLVPGHLGWMAEVQLLHSLIYLLVSSSLPISRWGSTLTLPDILDIVRFRTSWSLRFNSYTPWYTWRERPLFVGDAEVQLLHSLIYLKKRYRSKSDCWGSTLTLPDILGEVTQ